MPEIIETIDGISYCRGCGEEIVTMYQIPLHVNCDENPAPSFRDDDK